MKQGVSRTPRARPAGAPAPLAPGLGVPCAEAQADGVPCGELGVDCEECDRSARADHGSPGTEEAPCVS